MRAGVAGEEPDCLSGVETECDVHELLIGSGWAMLKAREVSRRGEQARIVGPPAPGNVQELGEPT